MTQIKILKKIPTEKIYTKNKKQKLSEIGKKIVKRNAMTGRKVYDGME